MISDYDISELRRIRHKVDTMCGAGVTNTDGSITIGPPPQARRIFPTTYEGKSRYRITDNSSGSFPVWSYTVQRVLRYNTTLVGAARWVTDGVDVTGVLNRCEFASPDGSYPYTYGTGNTITDSSGTVNDTTCVVLPIGIGSVVELSIDMDQDNNPVRSFYATNSAE